MRKFKPPAQTERYEIVTFINVCVHTSPITNHHIKDFLVREIQKLVLLSGVLVITKKEKAAMPLSLEIIYPFNLLKKWWFINYRQKNLKKLPIFFIH